MKTTLTIDDDILAVARNLARMRSKTIGRVISELARKGLESMGEFTKKNGIPVFSISKDATPITLEDVKKLEDGI